MDDKNMENEMTNGSQDDNKNNDNYEKIAIYAADRRARQDNDLNAGRHVSVP